MALQITKELYNGFSGNYWKITKIDVDFILKSINVVLSLYKDKATRDSRPDGMIDQTSFSYYGTDFADFIGILDERVVAYNKIKTANAFAKALDV